MLTGVNKMSETTFMSCRNCGDDVPDGRWELGFRLCLFCGEEAARQERMSWCVVQQYGKGPYQYVSATAAGSVLKGTNQKQVRG
jgi:hypothetical protein